MGQDKRGIERRELPHRAAPGGPWDGLVPPGRRRAGGHPHPRGRGGFGPPHAAWLKQGLPGGRPGPRKGRSGWSPPPFQP